MLLFLASLTSCSSEIEHIETVVIDGKVSATAPSRGGYKYRIGPKIWVQDSKNTKEVNIPFEYEGRWKVGDSCLLIIEKYRVKTK